MLLLLQWLAFGYLHRIQEVSKRNHEAMSRMLTDFYLNTKITQIPGNAILYTWLNLHFITFFFSFLFKRLCFFASNQALATEVNGKNGSKLLEENPHGDKLSEHSQKSRTHTNVHISAGKKKETWCHLAAFLDFPSLLEIRAGRKGQGKSCSRRVYYSLLRGSKESKWQEGRCLVGHHSTSHLYLWTR